MPQRIVSLVPSQTELLADLGLEAETVGITRFCVHPTHWYRSKPRVGGTKDFKFERIAALQPDLILANKEENTAEGIAQLSAHFRVWVSDIVRFSDALDMITTIGNLTCRQAQATQIINVIETARHQHATLSPALRPRAAYLIWRNPYMVAANNTFINSMLTDICGFDNAFAHLSRYPTLALSDLVDVAADVLFLSSEPYPFRDKHIAELRANLPAHTRIMLTNGEMWSWYGSRLIQAIPYLSQIIRSI